MAIDESQFSKDEKEGQYDVRFKVEAEINETIKAASLEDARAKAEAMAEDPEFASEIDGVDWIEISYLSKSPAMYRVTRDGKTLQVIRLKEGDLPREPNEYGF